MKKSIVTILSIIVLTAGSVRAQTVDFEDLTLGVEDYYNGSDDAGGFESAGVVFNNYFDDTYFEYWEGFAYSNTTDTVTEGYTNQYSAYPGSGAASSLNYGVAYQPGFYGYGTVPTITFPETVEIKSAAITNTTYAYLTVQNGDSYGISDKFGGESGDLKDWYLLTITGKDAEGNVTGEVEFYLADYRFEDNALDYIVSEWIRVDLTALGNVKRIEFHLTSSDTDPDPTIGMNTPSYVAVDNIEYDTADDKDDKNDLGCFLKLLGSERF
jgi:hypothetical protein